MLLQSLFPTLVLGLLPYLVNGAAFNPVEVPVYSTLDEPFVLSVQDDFRVVLKYSEKYGDYEPIISRAKTGLPAFKLTAGNLTTATGLVEEGYTAFTPAGPAVSPSKLSPVWFEKEPSRPLTIPFTAVTHRSGVLRLWSINYALVVLKLEEGEQVRLLTSDSVESTILKLDIHHTYHKFDCGTPVGYYNRQQHFKKRPEIK